MNKITNDNTALRAQHIAIAGSDNIDFSGLAGTIQSFRTLEYVRACQERIKASQAIGDREGKIDAAYRITQLPFTTLGSIGTLVGFFKNFPFSDGIRWIAAAFKASIIFGFICTAFESLYDSYWIFRETKLLNRPEMALLRLVREKPDLSTIAKHFEKHKSYYEKLLSSEELFQVKTMMNIHLSGKNYFEAEHRAQSALAALALRCFQRKYFEEGDDGQHAKLKRRLRPWCYEIVKQEIKSDIIQLESGFFESRKNGLEKAGRLFSLIEAQGEKKRLHHYMGVIYTALTIAALIATCVACPFAVPLSLILGAYLVGAAQWVLYSAYLDNPGWQFTPIAIIPASIRKLLSIEQQPVGQMLALDKNSLR